ncbi:NAD(P)H-dependent oxidoreductase [Chryseobacterium carnipullorum]|uniref:NAD(P)H-dependent oxidoreductase n=2 Tax=Chryseobacterium carnipullorum TaxID=1124835 RepID=A0A1M7M5G8_CHRCU|nr:nitroreductase family protein [Chryseobacterium carnipullorum]AZA49426.1 NAD(P)H-dependent oxidoreductase [Chryseobacterium carnipullorum]AZA64317.1 NAD(P)H-dependent oxidoreductase [Chryseobacterium carnipullorum]SHM85466.1 Nitroreductase [Chryseobacterium carnipullorum]
MNILEALNWRYATKRMTGEKLDEALVNEIIEAARLAPTSAGLQPFHIVKISNPEIKKQIQPIAFGQPQIIESSHLLVFTSWDKITDEQIDSVYNYTNNERGVSNTATADTVAGLKQLFLTFTEEEQYHHTAKQAHIGMGVAIVAAAQLGVDATPMEGFNKEGLDEFLKLREKGLRSVTLLALGRRKTDEDWLFPLKKVRQPIEQFVTEIK